jgi:hypothetical protein
MNSVENHELLKQATDPPPGPPLELRVLTGLQAGAALPLDQPLLVGRGDDCDLLLLDEQAPDHLLEIEPPLAPGMVRVTPMEGRLINEVGESLTGPVEQPIGQAFGTDGLWFEVQTSDSPWTTWTDPSERTASPVSGPHTNGSAAPSADADDAQASDLAPLSAQEQALSQSQQAAQTRTSASPPLHGGSTATDFDDWLAESLDPNGAYAAWATDPSDRRFTASRVSGTASRVSGVSAGSVRRWQQWMVISGGALLTLAGLVAMAVQVGLPAMGDAKAEAQPEAAHAGALPDTGLVGGARDAAGVDSTDAARISSATAVPPSTTFPSTPFPSSTPSTSSPASAPSQVSSLPAEPPPVRVQAGGGVTVVRGDTDITLPFEVREVILGARSKVVLSNGRMLLPGDAVGAWRLIEIKPGVLVFDGPERVLLPW